MARVWQEYGKSMARVWQEYGKSMARVWHHYGYPLPNTCETAAVWFADLGIEGGTAEVQCDAWLAIGRIVNGQGLETNNQLQYPYF